MLALFSCAMQRCLFLDNGLMVQTAKVYVHCISLLLHGCCFEGNRYAQETLNLDAKACAGEGNPRLRRLLIIISKVGFVSSGCLSTLE